MNFASRSHQIAAIAAKFVLGTALLLVVALLIPRDVLAQGAAPERSGFWINGGLGYGSAGVEDTDDREEGLSGNLTLGGTISPRFLLGGGTTGWTKEVDGIRVSLGTLAVMARFYPNADGGFFLNGGLGVGRVSVSASSVTVSDSGAGVILGLGYDVRLGSGDWYLSPFLNAIGISIEDETADIVQFGVGIAHH